MMEDSRIEHKPNLFLISPGPKYNLEHAFSDRCRGLSESFSGQILTSGPDSLEVRMGSFSVCCLGDKKGHSLYLFMLFIKAGFRLIKEKRKSGVDRSGFDLIVTYDPLKTGLIAYVLSFFSGIPFCVEVNGDYTSEVLYREVKGKYRRRLKRWIFCSVERFVLNRAVGIKLLYDNQIDYFKPLRHKPVIDRFPDYVNTLGMSNRGEEKIVLLVGFPLFVKGVDVLIDAFKTVSSEFPEWRLKILGFYPDKKQLEGLIGGHKRIFHHPPVDPSEIPEHIGRCGIFVLPSRTEAMGRVLIEAMACAKPRIGSAVGGIPTVIDDGRDGLLFHSEDVSGLADKLRLLMAKPDERQRLGQAAAERYRREFTRDKYFSQLSEFYRLVISCSL
ncbi:glycosyltransferase family 4 protein [Marinobacter nauticus]|uniref:glycosyltransferase family 4 protein n=1 Tax=Marinobacter nauticus TaxID=2743 RepID=UPI001CD66C17|nr:glycosyltransferase family 4 protein [Marinobacter nauticus]MCA0911874.1 glycosyltransferase family 4 protein [Marinobacter nauticus]